MIQPSYFKKELTDVFTVACESLGFVIPKHQTVIEKPRQKSHGDFCCVLSLSLSRQQSTKPRVIANDIINVVCLPAWVDKITIDGPGFINIHLIKPAKVAVIDEILADEKNYGRAPTKNHTILLEFVSANPTGPLHVGHGRACAYGDCLAKVLSFVGYEVICEYYINSAGRQIDILAASVWLRFWQQQGDFDMPSGSYCGDYLIDLAKSLQDIMAKTESPPNPLFEAPATMSDDDRADALVVIAKAACRQESVFLALTDKVCSWIMESIIKADMSAIYVDCETINFFDERWLHQEGKIEKVITQLDKSGCLYEKDGALWFKTSLYQDEKDRVVRRSNGQWTYYAADIAYHADKLGRVSDVAKGAYSLINVLGADHHGYVPRLLAALLALGVSPTTMSIEMIQFVSLLDDGVRLKMSTRAGEFVTLRQLIDDIGADATRYFYVSRKNDQHLDFDLAVAKARNQKNPVYYIQYAHARIESILRKWGEGESNLTKSALNSLESEPVALILCNHLRDYPDLLEKAACHRAPHLVATYLYELATLLHAYYDQQRILPETTDKNNKAIVLARLRLLLATRAVLRSGAAIICVSLPLTM